MAFYDLSHLTQPDSQDIFGPIQDDEALFLYSLIRGMRLKRILEIGGGFGYSANNFCKAVGENGVVYTIDINITPKMDDNHVVIVKNALKITPEDIDNQELHLVFFDCHEYNASLTCYNVLKNSNIITDKTILAFHDTNLYPINNRPTEEGFIHQPVERKLVNYFSDLGYNIFNLHTEVNVHNNEFPRRHGLSLAQNFKKFV
jgi:hypothetical protein